ncbi:MAG: hypothetical protein ACYTXY_15765 [Nostoc sp.]
MRLLFCANSGADLEKQKHLGSNMNAVESNPRKDEMPKKDERLAIPALGEYYNDVLTVDAWVNGRTKVVQAQSLLCAKLQERDKLIKERVEYLAKKRGITFDEMWEQILNGTAQKIVPGESEGLEYKPGDEG